MGAAYLIFLGIKSIIKKKHVKLNNHEQKKSTKSLFINGLLSNVLNPKVALFFLAFLPQFISNKSGNITTEILMLGIIFACFVLIFLFILGYFSGKIGNFLSKKNYINKKLHWATGVILILIGLRIAFIKSA